MRPIATDVTRSVIVCLCLIVGYMSELCINGITDRDAVWRLTPVGVRYRVLDRCPDFPKGRRNFWGCQSIPLKSIGRLLQCTTKRLNRSRCGRLQHSCRNIFMFFFYIFNRTCFVVVLFLNVFFVYFSQHLTTAN